MKFSDQYVTLEVVDPEIESGGVDFWITKGALLPQTVGSLHLTIESCEQLAKFLNDHVQNHIRRKVAPLSGESSG